MNGKRPPRHFEPKEFQSEHINDWCAGCGDHGILRALEQALSDSGLSPDEVAVFGGIGCSGKTPYYMNTYGIHTLHGRLLPFAAGAKLARPALTVIAAGGDGDGLSIGAGHFVNAGRRNLDLTYVFFNNGVYGLTKGQASPTLGRGEQTRSMPLRSIQEPLNPVLLAFAAGYTWIGRGYAYDVKGLAGLIRCPPWRAKRRRVVPGSREATRDTRRAEGAKGDPKGASERGVQSYGRPVCSRNELAMLWRNAG
ncbi:MAG: hypothetical protein DSZ02_10495 [Gammaproteobacteria bacterium]|nr:MAG: hypothetical protein DSZ02_10495 [Gammaproteobacteria bacterium]